MVLVDKGKLDHMISTNRVMAFTHLLYANDVFLFFCGIASDGNLLSHILDHYGTFLRQLVNWNKSYILFCEACGFGSSVINFGESWYSSRYVSLFLFKGLSFCWGSESLSFVKYCVSDYW